MKKCSRPFRTDISYSVFFEEGVFTKILRRYFLYDRKLLSDLSRCGWETLKEFFQEAVPEEEAVPGAVWQYTRLAISLDSILTYMCCAQTDAFMGMECSG